MFRFLETLRQRPQHEKQSIVFGTASVVTAIIFVIWVVTFSERVQSIDSPERVAGPEAGSFLETFQEGIEIFEENYSEVQQGISNIEAEFNVGDLPSEGSLNEEENAEETAQPSQDISGGEEQNVLE